MASRDVPIISPEWEKLDLPSEGFPHKASQSGQGGGRGSNTGTLRRDQGGGGGDGLRDGSAVEAGSSINVQRVERGASFLLKIKLIPESHELFDS